MTWFKRCSIGSQSCDCPNCNVALHGYVPSVDHHAVTCPNCGTGIVAFSLSTASYVIDIASAPDEMNHFLEWTQKSFDELQFMSLMAYLEEVLVSPASGESVGNDRASEPDFR